MNPQSLIGLFFGSFNPIHIGHLMIANYMTEFSGLHQVWFIVSPQNPLKEKDSLLADYHRLAMVNLAIENDHRFKSSDIEFKLPRPSYTIDTLTRLSEKYPSKEFVLIAGSDILPTFHKWKNHQELLNQYRFFIYPRPDFENSTFPGHPNLRFVDAPRIKLSSSFIREGIREGKDLRYFLPDKVWKYVQEMHFYAR